jgi:hypothetical protein
MSVIDKLKKSPIATLEQKQQALNSSIQTQPLPSGTIGPQAFAGLKSQQIVGTPQQVNQLPGLPVGKIPPPQGVMQGTQSQTGLQPPLTNINEQRTNTALTAYDNIKPFNFDYENDPGYKAARQSAITGVKNQMVNAGRLYSNRSDELMTQAALNVSLPFRQQAYNEYQMNQGESRNRINTFAGAEDRLRNQEIAQYGVALSPVARQYKTVYESMPPEMLNTVRAYRQDYAAEIMRREKIDRNDPLLPYLYAARAMKIMGSPALMGKYSQDISISAPGIAEKALTYDSMVLKNELDKITVQYAESKEIAELKEAVAKGDKAATEAAMKKVEAANLPAKLKAELNSKIADNLYKNMQAYERNTAALENLSSANLNAEKMNTEKAEQLKKFLESKKIDKESFDYKAFDRFDKFIQDQYMEEVTTKTSTGEDLLGSEVIEGAEKTGLVSKPGADVTSKTKFIKKGAHAALASYLLRLKENPDVDQDVVAALMAKYPINEVVGGKKEVLK